MHGLYTFKVMTAEKEKKGKEERRWTKSKISSLVFSTLLKVSRSFEVDIALE